MKKCKPNYRMNHFQGCGKVLPIFKYGSCQSCFIKWTQETKEGSAWLKKQTAYKFKKNQREKAKVEREKTKEMKIQLMSTSHYWSDVFQPRFNDVIRTIDKGSGCIVNNTPLGKMAAGHFWSIGSNKTLSINAHNVFLQSFQSNGWRGGEPVYYKEGLIRVFGKEYAEFVEGLKRCPALNITKIELIEAYQIILRLRREYKAEGYEFLSPLERIEMRNHVNSELGLYPKEFSIYPSC